LGWGHYLFDLPKLLGTLNSHQQTTFFEGYQKIRLLPDNFQQQLALIN